MDRHSSYIFIWLQLELCAMAVLLTKGECRGTASGDWGWGWGVGGPAVGLGDRRGGSRLCGGPLYGPGPGALKDSQTLGQLVGGELLNLEQGDDQTPLGSRTPTGLFRENADPNWAGQASLLVATKFLRVFLDV